MSGPLRGLRVLEFEAIGPAPFCAMLLADMGADVVLVDRPSDAQLGVNRDRKFDTMFRGRGSVTLDLKSDGGQQAARILASRADVVIEGFRPGVMERLGLGPDTLLKLNPRLVFGRMTGWGQSGEMAARAGHDLNFIALSGVLHAIGRPETPPAPPLNLIGDLGGGGMLLAFGVACAVLEARATGTGQVVDAAMLEGVGTLATMFSGMLAAGTWTEARGANLLDGGAPWYDCYGTSDGKYMAVGAIETRFYEALLQGLGLASDPTLPAQHDRAGWRLLRQRFSQVFASQSRDHWTRAFAGLDACVTPVLTFSEARSHPHATDRGNWITVDGVPQPAPAPRFSATPGSVRHGPPERGEGGLQALSQWGLDDSTLQQLIACGVGAR